MAQFKGSTGEILIDDLVELKTENKCKTRTAKMLIGCLFVSTAVLGALYALELSGNGLKGKDTSSGEAGKSGSGFERTTTAPPTTVPPVTGGPEPYWNVRLPSNIKPINYEVELKVFLQDKPPHFSGKTNIEIEVVNTTTYVILHVKHMDEIKAELRDSTNAARVIKRHEFKKNEFYVLELDKPLSVGKHSLYYEYKAKLATDLKGFYKSTFKTPSGETKVVAATQFQPTDARRAFPCFDEPAMKATFQITITYPKGNKCLTNMPEDGAGVPEGNFIKQRFQKSVKMPTYLVAFVVGPFTGRQGVVSPPSPTNPTMTFYAPDHQKQQLDFAIDVGPKMFTAFREYYQVEYPLPKLDMIAIPDFSAGAMENWGLVTYRETALLFEKGVSSESNLQRIAIVIAHELAHQWFGNIVTNKWWSDLWLNEGFASYVEYYGVNKVRPSWMINDQFVIKDYASALYADSLKTSHPIYVPVGHPNEINEIFDSISYSKGGSILRMLENYISEPIFQKGLKSYLTKYKFGNAETADLWASLNEAAKTKKPPLSATVGDIMNTWTMQMGYPVISMDKQSDGTVKISQRRFLLNPNSAYKSKYKSPFNYTWKVPFSFVVYGNPAISGTTFMYLDKDQDTLKYKGSDVKLKPSDLMKGNVGHYGFYRVKYDKDLWKAVKEEAIKLPSRFDHKDLAGILSDCFALARAGLYDYSYPLDILHELKVWHTYLPWKAALSGFSYLSSMMTENKAAVKSYLAKKIDVPYKSYRAEAMSDGIKKLGQMKIFRLNLLVSYACSVGVEDCVKYAKIDFDKWIADPVANEINVEDRSHTYFYGIAQSGAKEWNTVFKRYQESTVASERIKFLYGLSAAQEPWIILRYLNYSLDDSKVKSQDTSYVFSYIANYNSMGRHYAWMFLKANWQTLAKKFGGGFFSMRRIVDSVTSGFKTEYELRDFDRFMSTIKDRGTADRAITEAREKIKANIYWLQNYGPKALKWIKSKL